MTNKQFEDSLIHWGSTKNKGKYFVKMHGLDNHFVIVDGRDDQYEPDADEIIKICHSRHGVGADQLIVIQNPTKKGVMSDACALMRIFNIDGNEAEACGNATRCVAWLLMEELSSNFIKLETLAGILECHKTGRMKVSSSMGKVEKDWRKIPLNSPIKKFSKELNIGPLKDPIILSIGNPHIIYFVENPDKIDIELWAPKIQSSSIFPNQVNVGIAKIVDGNNLQLRVFERGVGLTSACGSGACAAVYASIEKGLAKTNKMRVHMTAGYLDIKISQENIAIMEGPVAFSFAGKLIM